MRNTIVNNGWNTTEWGLAFLRVSSFPLDPSLVFEDELEFTNYLSGKDTDKPYIGQLVAVKKKDAVTSKPAPTEPLPGNPEEPDTSAEDDANFDIYLVNSVTLKTDNKTIDKWNAIVLNGKELEEIKKIIDEFKEQVKQDLVDLYDKIEGGASDEFNTLKKLQDYLLALEVKTTQGISNLQKELDTTQIGVGLSQDGSFSADKETHYLGNATSVMNALKILDGQLNQAIVSFNFRADNKDIVPLEITKQDEATVISASLLFSNVDGNQLIKKADGIYNKVRLEYDKGTLTLKVNDNVIDTFNTAVTSLIQEAKYDPATESIVIVFNTEQGDSNTITIPVGALIREWEPDNTQPTKVVELTREIVNGGGADKLSADVRLSSNTRNILVKDNNTLLVEGTTDNITYKDQNLTDVIDQLKAKDTTNDEALDQLKNDLQNEVNRATQAETQLRTDLDKEIDRSTSKDTDLQNQIDTNKTAADKTADDLQKEIERAKAAEQANKDAITAETTRATTEEGKLRNDLTNEINRSTSKDDDLQKQVDTNKAAIADNTKNITANSDAIKAEVTRATTAETTLNNNINNESTRAQAEEKRLNDLIDKNSKGLADEVTRATAAEKTITDNLTAEVKRSTDKDNEHDTSINNLRNDLTAETNRATAKEDDLQKQIDSNKTSTDKVTEDLQKEVERATAAEQANSKAITDEVTRATQAEQNLDHKITDEATRAQASEKSITDNLNAEIERAKAAESNNSDRITENKQSITDLTTKLNDEITRATTAEKTNSDAIKAEVDRATEAEKDLLDKINASSVVNTVQVEDTSSVDLTATKGDTNVTLKADVRVSDEAGNMIKSKSNGLFTSSNLKYEASTNTLTYNDGNTDTVIQLSAGTLVNNIVYDKSTESIIFTYTNAQGKDATINVPVADLIEEWDIQNNEDSPITLTKSRDIPGKDILTAAIKVSNTGLLQIKDGYLYVSNNATDIIYQDKTSVAEAISKEIADRTNADSQLNDKVTQEVNRATTAEQKITSDLATEVNRATTEEKRLEGLITTNKTDVDQLKQNLQDEINRATQKEKDLDNKINDEINRATAKEETLDNKITTETDRAQQAENDLSKKIDTETNRSTTKEAELETRINENAVAIEAETDRATKVEEDLQKQVDDLNDTVTANFAFKSATIEPTHANVGDTVDVVLNWSFTGVSPNKEIDSQVLNENPIDKTARTFTFKGVTETTQYRIVATYRGVTAVAVLNIVFSNPVKLGIVDNTNIDDEILTELNTYDDTYPIRVDCTGGKYAVLAVEHNKVQSLLINNLPLGDYTLTNVDHINGDNTITYDVYRSNNKYNGTIILDII